MKHFYIAAPLLALIFINFGCAHQVHEVIMSSPQDADIYWGKAASELTRANRQTLNSRSATGHEWESWCYQAFKDGYLPSQIICRPDGDKYRVIEFRLQEIKTYISSVPPGAEIFWGPAEDNLTHAYQETPWTEDRVHIGANYQDWYFQVKKYGYQDSEIIFMPHTQKDREIQFELQKVKN